MNSPVHVEKEGSSPAEFVINEVQQRQNEFSILNCKFDLEIIFVSSLLCSDKGVVFRGKSTEQRQEAAPSA